MIRAGLAVLVLALVVGGWQSWRLSTARADLAQAKAALSGYQEAERWRMAEDRRRAAQSALDLDLQQGAGSDAPLSDYLRGGAGRVWP